jgi:hypothetical protein
MALQNLRERGMHLQTDPAALDRPQEADPFAILFRFRVVDHALKIHNHGRFIANNPRIVA